MSIMVNCRYREMYQQYCALILPKTKRPKAIQNRKAWNDLPTLKRLIFYTKHTNCWYYESCTKQTDWLLWLL